MSIPAAPTIPVPNPTLFLDIPVPILLTINLSKPQQT